MIYVKIETQSREKSPKPSYLRGDNWHDIFEALSRWTVNDCPPLRWHTVKLHTISEAEFNRHTHPELPGMGR